MTSGLRTFLDLTKFRIAAFSTLSALTGYLVFSRTFRWGLLSTFLGVLLVAMGACALNEWQDRKLDARMARTRNRPLPAARMRPREAMVIALVLLVAGLLVLWLLHNLPAALLGLFAVAWYNTVYTYLKRVSAFAVVPGSIIGAVPPAIGWTAAGGDFLDPHVLALCFFFFIWQVPHFWLLLYVYGGEYEEVGLPSLTKVFTREQLARLTFMWITATAGSSLLLRVYGLISPYWSLGLAAAGIWLVWQATWLLRRTEDRASFRLAFRCINLYALLVMVLLIVDATVWK